MSDLFRSLSKRDEIEPQQGKDIPRSAEVEKAKDIVLTLVGALVSAGQIGWTVAEIAQRGGLSPTVALTAIQEAIKFGLIAENNDDPERKRFRLTGAGYDLAHTH